MLGSIYSLRARASATPYTVRSKMQVGGAQLFEVAFAARAGGEGELELLIKFERRR